MLKKILMPDAGQTAEQLIIVKWLKSVGDTIARGDVLLEVETGKAVMPVESFTNGILLKICFQEGDTANAGDILAYIGDEMDRAELAENSKPENTSLPVIPSKNITPSPTAVKLETQKPADSKDDKTLRASPAAKKAARDANIPIEHLGRTGSIIRKKDVQLYINTLTPASAGSSAANSIPSFTLEIEADISKLQDMLKRGFKATIQDIITKCAAIAAEKYPLVKSTNAGDDIRQINLASYGIKRSSAVINPPETCVLAAGAVFNCPYLDNGVLKERPVISVTASFDHRVIENDYGAAFLACLRDYLENPVLLFM